MGRWRSGRGRWIAVAGLVAFVGLSSALRAQQAETTAQEAQASKQKTEPPTLGEILQRLQENVDQYQALVPSFFCDEHVVATTSPDPQHESSVTDSTFRLKRVANPEAEGKTILEESHEVKMVNGRPATGDTVNGPAFLRGAFSNGLALVSASQQACMRYTLRPIRQNKSSTPYVIQFASVPARDRPHECGMQEDVSGRVLIDPETMQVTHMEFTAPHHFIGTAVSSLPGLDANPIEGRWDVTVEYAPVLLGGKSFWLPTKVSDRLSGSFIGNRWLYDATYSNYHKLEVTSRILPASEEPAP
jgi:hypothetical protein